MSEGLSMDTQLSVSKRVRIVRNKTFETFFCMARSQMDKYMHYLLGFCTF